MPWLALECLREKAGHHPCDRRRSVAEVKQDFPSVDFSGVPDEEDVYFESFNGGRETDEQIVARAQEFFHWLEERPEKNIAVVTHSAFLSVLFNKAVACGPELSRWFDNCEMRSAHFSLSRTKPCTRADP